MDLAEFVSDMTRSCLVRTVQESCQHELPSNGMKAIWFVMFLAGVDAATVPESSHRHTLSMASASASGLVDATALFNNGVPSFAASAAKIQQDKERIMKAQALRDNSMTSLMVSEKIMANPLPVPPKFPDLANSMLEEGQSLTKGVKKPHRYRPGTVALREEKERPERNGASGVIPSLLQQKVQRFPGTFGVKTLVTSGVKKPHRYRPGTVALREEKERPERNGAARVV